MSWGEIAFAVVSGLLINECSDVAPWIARALAVWSARLRYADKARAQIRAEELAALINDRPGKLFKLLTALAFVFVGLSGLCVGACSRLRPSSLSAQFFRDHDRFARSLGWTRDATWVRRTYRDPRFDTRKSGG
ncbi:hypothetical protein ACIBK1_33190 [Microbispora rosea]|uniref:hypothetical protein n=1 Tax=Microbispora rosea TaxID=58117 RepID=UPI003792B5ED